MNKLYRLIVKLQFFTPKGLSLQIFFFSLINPTSKMDKKYIYRDCGV